MSSLPPSQLQVNRAVTRRGRPRDPNNPHSHAVKGLLAGRYFNSSSTAFFLFRAGGWYRAVNFSQTEFRALVPSLNRTAKFMRTYYGPDAIPITITGAESDPGPADLNF